MEIFVKIFISFKAMCVISEDFNVETAKIVYLSVRTLLSSILVRKIPQNILIWLKSSLLLKRFL